METEYFEHPSGYFGVYDSKGIEVGQGGDKILADFRELIAEKRRLNLREQIHVIWYCVRAADLRFENSQAKFIEELAASERRDSNPVGDHAGPNAERKDQARGR